MLAYDPQYRTDMDKSDFGTERTMTDAEIADVAEYVLQLGGQQHDAAAAARGAVLFQDNAKGNCFDCHGDDGAGILAFGSSNLTQPKQYLYGSDRASILESIIKGRHGMMPAFDKVLKPEEIKAVSVFVFSRAAPMAPAPQTATAP
jgi:cytochrome c oxidase cbb3-type subunit 3